METTVLRVAICAIASNENLYLRDWVRYHIGLGVKKIVLFDNSPLQGDCPQMVIGDYVSSGWVTIIHVRKKSVNPVLMQEMCYTAGYQAWHKDYDFMLFIDIDEYLTLRDGLTLQEWLKSVMMADLVKLNWMCYTDNGMLHYDNRPVTERFTEPMMPLNKADWWNEKHPVNSTIKTMVNCKQREASFLATKTPHICLTNKRNNAVAVTAGGKPVHPMASACMMDYDAAWIRHYRTLTIDEFLYRRFTRGIGDARSVSTRTEDLLKIFGVENEITDEKQAIVDEFFGNGPGRALLEFEEKNPDKIGEGKLEYDPEFFKMLREKVNRCYTEEKKT